MLLFLFLLFFFLDFFLFEFFLELLKPFFVIVQDRQLPFFGAMFRVLFGRDKSDLFMNVDSAAKGPE
jgi:hypothetical protein